jgi:hypothetical protein
MAAINVNGLNINDNISFVVEEVHFRHIPTRQVFNDPISRRPGSKLTGVEWGTKEIEIKGYVFSPTVSGLRGKIDTMQQNFSVQSLALSIDTDRTYTATLTELEIPTQFYNNSYVNFDARFLAVDPFAYGSQITASGTVASGTALFSSNITISGTVFAGPTLTINPRGASVGDSGIKGMKFTYVPTGETVTISGVFNYTSPVTVDFNNYLVTNSGVSTDYSGIFPKFEPGVSSYSITVNSGVANSYNYTWSYQPRYYQ